MNPILVSDRAGFATARYALWRLALFQQRRASRKAATAFQQIM
jgi:hypothetical protein